MEPYLIIGVFVVFLFVGLLFFTLTQQSSFEDQKHVQTRPPAPVDQRARQRGSSGKGNKLEAKRREVKMLTVPPVSGKPDAKHVVLKKGSENLNETSDDSVRKRIFTPSPSKSTSKPKHQNTGNKLRIGQQTQNDVVQYSDRPAVEKHGDSTTSTTSNVREPRESGVDGKKKDQQDNSRRSNGIETTVGLPPMNDERNVDHIGSDTNASLDSRTCIQPPRQETYRAQRKPKRRSAHHPQPSSANAIHQPEIQSPSSSNPRHYPKSSPTRNGNGKRECTEDDPWSVPDDDTSWSPDGCSHCSEQCVIFIDNSNLFIEGQKYYAKHLKLLVKQDPRCRIDIGKLITIAFHGRSYTYGKLYGSEPPALDTVWRKIREHIEVDTYHKNFKGKEKSVDTALSAEAVEYAMKHQDKAANQTMIIVSGDRDYCPAVNIIIKYGWKVEIVAFKASISTALRKTPKEKCTIFELEDMLEKNAKTCCFVESRWKMERRRRLPRDRTKVLIFEQPFDIKKSVEDKTAIRQLANEITSITQVPCYYHCGLNTSIIFIIGYDVNHKRPGEQFGDNNFPQPETSPGSKRLDFYRIWKTKRGILEQKCQEICSTHSLTEILDILNFLQKPESQFIVKLENRFRSLQPESTGEYSDFDEYGDDYEYQDQDLLQLNITDDEFGEDDDDDYTKVERPPKPPHASYSEPCQYEFCCIRGIKCQYTHTEEQRLFFQSRNGEGVMGYKSKPCYFYHHHRGKDCGGRQLEITCPYYHSIEEARCYMCKKIGLPYIGHGSHDHDTNDPICP